MRLTGSLFLLLGVSIVYAAPKKSTNPDDVKADSIVYDKPTEWRIFSTGAPVKAFASQNDLIWMATEEGVQSQSVKKKDTRQYPDLGGIPSTEVTSMIIDKIGRVWIGGKNGVAVKNGNTFTSYTADKGLPDNSVLSLVAGVDGSVWVGTENGLAQIKNDVVKTFTSKDGLPSDRVQCLLIDSKGALWCGTNKGIGIYDGAKWSIQSMKQGMSWNDTKVLALDTRNGQVWAAVGEKDINFFDKSKWNVFMEIQEGITSIMVDTQGRVWVGHGSGLIKFNGDEWITDNKQHGVPAAQVHALYKDDGGNLWYGMESGVLRLSNPYPY